MSYANAAPKVLKLLVSDGKLVDESGNVIAESDTLQDLYIKSSPQVKKYLLSDGSVVDENNNLIIKNDYFKKVYDQAEPKVAKYLHSDGTIDENPGGGSGADLEDNKTATIDVSTYTEPVEITPTAGKDGMKKTTVTLNNIPSGGSAMLYAWDSNDGTSTGYLNINNAPSDPADANNIKLIRCDNTTGVLTISPFITSDLTYAFVSDTEFTITYEVGGGEFDTISFTRNSTKDVEVWG